MSEGLSPITEERLINVLKTLPIPITISYEQENRLYYWESPPYGKGTALLFEVAVAHALACVQHAHLTKGAKESAGDQLPTKFNPSRSTSIKNKFPTGRKTAEGQRQDQPLQLFTYNSEHKPPDTMLIRATLAFATFLFATYSSATLSLLLASWWMLVVSLLVSTILSIGTMAWIEHERWAGDQTVMGTWTFLVFTPLGGYIGWLATTLIAHWLSFPTIVVIIGNALGVLAGLVVGFFGYVFTVALITGKQFSRNT